MLNSRLCSQLKEYDILCEEQNGFRPERSCEEHIYSLTSVIANRKISRQSTFVSFMNTRKVFDSVPRNFLFYKLRRAGVHGRFLSAIQWLYDNVKCTVRVNDRYTLWFDVDCSVKQGCLLSPALFAIYINDLSECINNLEMWCRHRWWSPEHTSLCGRCCDDSTKRRQFTTDVGCSVGLV